MDPGSNATSAWANITAEGTTFYFRRPIRALNSSVDIPLNSSLYVLFANGPMMNSQIAKHDTKFVVGQYDFACRKYSFDSEI